MTEAYRPGVAACPTHLSVEFARKLLDLETWGPFAGVLGFLLVSILSLRSVMGPPRQPEADGLGSSPVHQ